MQKVVITGLGWSTSLGGDTASCWRNLIAGECGFRTISHYDPSEYTARVAAEVTHIPHTHSLDDPEDTRRLRRAHRLFVPVLQEAFRDASLQDGSVPGDRIGIAAATSVNYIDVPLMSRFFASRQKDGTTVDFQRLSGPCRVMSNNPRDNGLGNTDGNVDGSERDDGFDQSRRTSAFFRRHGDTLAGLGARVLNISGPSFVMDTACAASSHAIGEAYRLIRRGKATAMIAGGTAALVTPPAMLAFSLLGALSRSLDPATASRPFDRNRDGFVMGEGAGAVVLESLDSALARGARIYAELAGYGATSNAYSLTDPSPGGCSEARAMSLALAEAGCAPGEVDYIAAHGTSTPKNDATETAAIRLVFEKHANRLLVSSNKGQIGHTISAAGVCNLISAVKAITEGIVPPTMHLDNPDPDCNLDYVANQSRSAKLRVALVNAFAFGGQNAVLAVRTWAGA